MTQENQQPLVYLAGPIDFVTDEAKQHWSHWRSSVTRRIQCAVYDPASAFGGMDPAGLGLTLKAINDTAIQQSDALLAAVWPNQPSWGTPIEIEYANSLGIPVVLWAPDGCPPYLTGYERYEGLINAIGAAERAACTRVRHQRDFLFTGGGISEPALEGDVGYDLHALEDATIWPHPAGRGYARIPVGDSEQLHVAVPMGRWMTIAGRSSMNMRGLHVPVGVIDPGYRGPIYVFAANFGKTTLEIKKGDRIAQAILHTAVIPPLRFVDELPSSQRGTRGFGSTGD